MRSRAFWVGCFFCQMLAIGAVAQTPFPQNYLYVEAGGAGLFGSVNYERQLTRKPGLGVRAGIGMYTENAFYLTLPVGINYLFALNKPNQFIDASLQVTWAKKNADIFNQHPANRPDHFTSFCPGFGYRWHTGRRVMLRASAHAVINRSGGYPWAGFAIGKAF